MLRTLITLIVILALAYLVVQPATGQTIPPPVHLPLVINSDVGTALPTATPSRTPTRTVVVVTSTPTATGVPSATPTATPIPILCDASYPTVCIPPPPPDLNCGDIPFRRFTVLPPDPHNFDSDRDGVGCESGYIEGYRG